MKFSFQSKWHRQDLEQNLIKQCANMAKSCLIHGKSPK